MVTVFLNQPIPCLQFAESVWHSWERYTGASGLSMLARRALEPDPGLEPGPGACEGSSNAAPGVR